MTRTRRYLLTVGTLLLFPAAGLAQTATPPPTQTPPPLMPKPDVTQPAPKASAPFPADAKVAYIDMQVIFAESNIGKQGLVQMKALNDRFAAAFAARDKEMQGLSDKMRTQQGLVSPQVFNGWSVSLQKLQREAQFAQQEAQVEVNQLQEQLLSDFEDKVRPVVEAIRSEKGLWIVFSIDSAAGGLSVATAHPGVDLSGEVTKRLNAAKD